MFQTLLNIGILCSIVCTPYSFAQDAEVVAPLPDLQAIITGPKDIAVGRTLVLDASTTEGLTDDTEIRWYVSGVPQPISRSMEAVYTPLEPGTVTIRLRVSRGSGEDAQESETEQVITVYNRKIVLIADTSVPPEKIVIHQQSATQQGLFLRVLQPKQSTLSVDQESALASLIKANGDEFQGAQSIVIWSDGITGIQALLRAFEADEARLQLIQNQTIVLISGRGLQTLARTALGPFSVLKPQQIFVTRKEAINPLISAQTLEAFRSELEQRDIDFEIIDESSVGVRPWNVIASLVNYMLTHGVPSQTVILLLSLPIIATILAFLKQVIGVTTLGLYTPSVIALGFITLGWKVGVPFILLIVLSGYATRSSMRGWRLLYIPKVAITITVVSLTLLVLLGISASFGLILSGDKLFILLIMSTLSESFFNLKAEEGWKGAIFGVGETIAAALVCAFIVQLTVLKSMILAYPELILLTLLINVFLGQWTGLRLVEYFRFREVFKHIQEE